MTNEISWRHRNPSNPNRPAEPGRTEVPILEATDLDGDSVGYQLTVCENPSFSGCTPSLVAIAERLVQYAGIGSLCSGIVLFSMAVGGCIGSRKKQRLQIAIFFGLLGVGYIAGCGGSSDKADEPIDEISHTISGLNSGTTYYWKVTAP